MTQMDADEYEDEGVRGPAGLVDSEQPKRSHSTPGACGHPPGIPFGRSFVSVLFDPRISAAVTGCGSARRL